MKSSFFLGHHKAATTWVAHLLTTVGRLCRRNVHYLDNPSRYKNDLAKFESENRGDIFLLVNSTLSEFEIVRDLGPTVHVYRNPRTTLISSYFSHVKTHPIGDWIELEAHRVKLKSLSLEDGLIEEIEFSGQSILDLASMTSLGSCTKEIKFEALVANPLEHAIEIVESMGLLQNLRTFGYAKLGLNLLMSRVFKTNSLYGLKGIPAELVLSIAWRNRFDRLKNSASGHYRNGNREDSENYFTDRVEKAFTARFSTLAEDLGYEK